MPFFLEETVVNFIHSISCYTIRKRKEGQTMTSSFSFATLIRARATQLHFKRNNNKGYTSKLFTNLATTFKTKKLYVTFFMG